MELKNQLFHLTAAFDMFDGYSFKPCSYDNKRYSG